MPKVPQRSAEKLSMPRVPHCSIEKLMFSTSIGMLQTLYPRDSGGHGGWNVAHSQMFVNLSSEMWQNTINCQVV